MRAALTLHPDSVCEAVARIDVDIARGGNDVLGLRFVAEGRTAGLALPPPSAAIRVNGLWQHTCFEAFFADPEGEGYTELNVAPSTQWAGYRFARYRGERRDAPVPPPRVDVAIGDDRLEVSVALRLGTGARRRIGLSAVIEEVGGRKSYWALAHPPGAPDFHHPACFALELPPPA